MATLAAGTAHAATNADAPLADGDTLTGTITNATVMIPSNATVKVTGTVTISSRALARISLLPTQASAVKMPCS